MPPAQPHKPARCPWKDRFTKPTLDLLLARYQPQPRALADQALTELAQITAARPAIEWLGPSWRWSLAYRLLADPEPACYFVPTPDWPSIALPVPLPIAEDILTRRGGSKYLREVLLHATQVGQTRWAVWTLQGKAQLADVLRLAAGIVQGQPV